MPDWKKEIRVSDLFKKTSKEDTPVVDDATTAGAEPTPSSGEASPASPVPEPPPHVPPAVEPSTRSTNPSTPSFASPPQAGSPKPVVPGSAPPAQAPAASDPGSPPPGATPAAGRPPAHGAGSGPSVDPSGTARPVPPQSHTPSPAEPPAAPTGHADGPQTDAPPASTAVSSQGEQDASPWKRELRATDLLKKMGWSGGSKGPPGKASDQRTPRPDAPAPPSPQPDSPVERGADPGVWKRELRAGDLFRRREAAPSVPGDAFSEGGSEPVSFWKKELSLADLLRTSEDTAETVTGPAPAEVPAKDGGKTKKSKSRALPKLDLKRGSSSFGKKNGATRGPATTPIAVPLTRAVNLLPPDLVATKTRRFGPAEIGVAVAAVVVIAGLALAVMSASSRVAEAEDQVVALEQQQAALQQAALDAAAGAGLQADPLLGEELARATALSDALGSRTVWDRVLRQVTVVMPADLWLRGLSGTSTTPDLAASVGVGTELSSTLTLTGFALTSEAVAQLLSRMETIPELSTVQLLAATVTEISAEEVVEFSITATLKDFAETSAPSSIGATP